jgi:NhaP-type Na+/H+ or K+/H+ antiporter
VNTTSPTAGDVILQFFRLSAGGPLLGLVSGVLISFWMKRIQNIPMLEANLTIFASYLLFYSAEETILKVSGILAMVTMGLYMSRLGKT